MDNHDIKFPSKDILNGACLAHQWLTLAKMKGDPDSIRVFERILKNMLDDYDQAVAREGKKTA